MSVLVRSHVSKPSSLPRTHGAEARGAKGAKSTLPYPATAFNYLWDHLYSSNTRQILQRQIIILKSYRQGFHKNYKKRALLKSIFVIPIRVSFFQILQHKTLLKMKKYFATRFNGEGSPWPGRNCRSYDISCKYLNPHIVFVFCVCRLIGRIV